MDVHGVCSVVRTCKYHFRVPRLLLRVMKSAGLKGMGKGQHNFVDPGTKAEIHFPHI